MKLSKNFGTTLFLKHNICGCH